MKKVVSVVMVFTMLLGCADAAVQKYLREDSYEIGMEALAVADEFLNGDIEADKAEEQLNKLENKAKNLEFSENESSEESFNSIMATDISLIALNISMYDSPYGSVTKADVKEVRNVLADMLGEKKMK